MTRAGPRGRAFDAALRALAEAPPVPLEVLAPGPSPGERIGALELGEVIGEGATSVVYRARDPRLGRDVAVKVLSPRWDGALAPEVLLEREALAGARLRHPGVVALHRAGRRAGRFYLVFELLEGQTLDARLRRGPIGRGEAILTALAVCHALGHAHRRGVVHRDVKPANVFLEAGGGVKLIDFGLSVDLAGRSAGDRSGTPAYMAPEQRRGAPADPRADVHAAGVVLRELLAAARDGVASPALDEIAARAASPAPDDRHADGGAMAEAIAAAGHNFARPALPWRRWPGGLTGREPNRANTSFERNQPCPRSPRAHFAS